jgi:DNA segregation ATPase FtsK/SpoIIIE, S-DNA-T family
VPRYRNPYRPYRRGGARRNQPVPLFILPPHDPIGAAGAVVGGLFRAARRYRSELAPVAVAAAVWWLGWRLHAAHPAGWPFIVSAVAVGIPVVVWGPSRWPRLRRARLLAHPSGRYVLAAWLAAGGGWLAAATAVGPSHPPLGALWLWGTVLCGVPWWVNHWRRARVRLARTVQMWPELTDTVVGLAGSRIASAVVDAWGWTARVVLHRGQTVRAVVDHMASIESALATRPGAVRIEPDQADARAFTLRVIEIDPHAEPISWPGLAARTAGTGTITRPVALGVFEDGSPVTVSLAWRHVLIGGSTGAGKSALLSVVLAVLTGCPDVILWGIDLKQGIELSPWSACLHRLATTPEDAAATLSAAVDELDRRAALLADHGARVWHPTRTTPALVLIVDEYAELPDAARAHADSIARRGRAVAVTLLVATQRPTQAAMGHGAVRSQMDVRICLRVRERRDTDLILGQGAHATGWHAEALTLPGTFLLSAPEHQVPRRARGYLLTDDEVTAIARRHAPHRPAGAGQHTAGPDHPAGPARQAAEKATDSRTRHALPRATSKAQRRAEKAIREALRGAGPNGITGAELVHATGISRSAVYRYLQNLALTGRAEQTGDGRWRATETT